MIAVYEWVAPAANTVLIVVVALVGFISLRSGSHRANDASAVAAREAQAEALDAQARQIVVLEREKQRLEERLQRSEVECKSQISHLEGRVEELAASNEELRRLVLMSEKVSPALIDAIATVGQKLMAEVVTAYLQPMAEQIRLLERADRPAKEGG